MHMDDELYRRREEAKSESRKSLAWLIAIGDVFSHVFFQVTFRADDGVDVELDRKGQPPPATGRGYRHQTEDTKDLVQWCVHFKGPGHNLGCLVPRTGSLKNLKSEVARWKDRAEEAERELDDWKKRALAAEGKLARPTTCTTDGDDTVSTSEARQVCTYGKSSAPAKKTTSPALPSQGKPSAGRPSSTRPDTIDANHLQSDGDDPEDVLPFSEGPSFTIAVDKTVQKNGLLSAHSLAYHKGVAFVCEKSNIALIEVEGTVTVKVSSFKKLADIRTELERKGLSTDGTMKQHRARLQNHLNVVEMTYGPNKPNQRSKLTIAEGPIICPGAIWAKTNGDLVIGDNASKTVVTVQVTGDGIGLIGTMAKCADYPMDCVKVLSVCIDAGGWWESVESLQSHRHVRCQPRSATSPRSRQRRSPQPDIFPAKGKFHTSLDANAQEVRFPLGDNVFLTVGPGPNKSAAGEERDALCDICKTKCLTKFDLN
ncbi:Hypp6735 [Branchiostoma lanceolatum]|uniref:Hypp6735 protein n=1 Tax=Branchiostoma lanceolatum TaxID=7740 RepID=A0A8J9YVJ9_BRALA|nr:Hypp6735 [Branchiostoma lanceolatum]